MGSVFGKESVKEPPFDVLLRRTDVATPYELRRYGERFAASVEYAKNGDNDNSPFRTLARYIGVFGTPENEGSTGIAMTAPVVMERDGGGSRGEPESIAMTAPVVMENTAGDGDGDGGGTKKMMFMLPAEYDELSKIPKPTNPAVHIEELPSEVGAVYRYRGSFDDDVNRAMARRLGDQLANDGVPGVTAEYAVDRFQFWGYNPPFTLPYFRRNEVWVRLDAEQATYLEEAFPSAAPGGRLVGGSSPSIAGRGAFALGLCGLVVGVLAVGLVNRSRTQYQRL